MILIISKQYFTFVAPLSRIHYPDTRCFINAYNIFLIFKWLSDFPIEVSNG